MGQIPGCHGHGHCLTPPYNGSKIINHLLECDIPYFGLISIPVFKSRLKRHLLFMQSKSRSGDEDWLQCNHDIFSDITL